MIHTNENGVKLLGCTVADVIRKCGASENKNVKQKSFERTTENQKTMQ